MYVYMDSFELPNSPVKRMAIHKRGDGSLSPSLLIENKPSQARI